MNDHLTTRLTRQLHAQADDWQGAPLTLESVQGKARTIQRRRRAVAGSALAVAVLAVAIPIGVTFGGGSDTSPPPANPPTRLVDTDNPVEESPLRVSFIEGRTLTLPDGAQTRLPQAYQGGAVLGDTVFGLRNDNGDLSLDVLDGSGGVDETIPLDTGFASNADGSAIAYVTGGELVVRWDGGQTRLGEVGPVELVRLVGGPDCTLGADDCVVYYNDGETPRFLNNSGEGAEVPGVPLSVSDVDDERRVAMLSEVTLEPGSCSRVVDQQAQQEIFSTCKYTLGRFSPDGAHLSATHPYEDGFGDAFHAILDSATSAELGRYEPGQGGAVYYSVWEDSEHLLVLSYEDNAWVVTRLGTDGSTEIALPPVAGSQEEPAYVLLGATF